MHSSFPALVGGCVPGWNGGTGLLQLSVTLDVMISVIVGAFGEMMLTYGQQCMSQGGRLCIARESVAQKGADKVNFGSAQAFLGLSNDARTGS